jgi:hypothetical protein
MTAKPHFFINIPRDPLGIAGVNPMGHEVQDVCNKIFRVLANLQNVENPEIAPGLCRIDARLFLSILFAISVCRDIEQFYKLSDGTKLLKMIEEYLDEDTRPVVECNP